MHREAEKDRGREKESTYVNS